MRNFLLHWLVITLFAASVQSAQAQTNVYTEIYNSVLLKNPRLKQDIGAREHVLLRAKTIDDTLTDDQITAIITNNYLSSCTGVNCVKNAEPIQNIYDSTINQRDFARQLQRIAYSYEAGTIGITNDPGSLANIWPSIRGIWLSGTDNTISTQPSSMVRFIKLDDEYDSKIQDILSEITALTTNSSGLPSMDELEAAVHRYRHGYRDLFTESSCESHNNDLEDEPNLLLAIHLRYCDLENAINRLYEALQDYEYDPPLQTGEIAVFTRDLFMNAKDKDVYIWARNDDIGLNWIYGIDSPHSTLVYEDELVETPWDYDDPPEEPDFLKGLCSHPLAKEGYMCRPVSAELCPVDPDDCLTDDSGGCADTEGKSVIGLLACTPSNIQKYTRESPSGQNICQIGAWLEQPVEADGYDDLSQIYHDKDSGENDDIVEEMNECSNCVIDFYCSDSCPARGDEESFAFQKTDTGIQKVCIPNSVESHDRLIYYLAIHETVHAQQMCGQPPNTNIATTAEQCCAAENEAYVVTCNALWEDGILQQTDYTIEQCAAILSNVACNEFGEKACTIVETDAEEFTDDLVEVFEKQDEDGVPMQSCEEVIANPTSKLTSMVASTGPVCNPNCAAKYENTIGNNLCYIGQCIEQSWEQNRLVPGRVPSTTQEQAFPWESCMNPDPQLGTIGSVAAGNTTRLPVYEPFRLVEQVDKELCRLNGYPLQTPPVLCMYNSNESVNLTFTTAFTLSQVTQERMNNDALLRSITGHSLSNVSNRNTSAMLATYLKTAILSMNEVLSNVQRLLLQIGTVQLPTVMCPREPITSCSYFEQTTSP